jgi:hypothetical protein
MKADQRGKRAAAVATSCGASSRVKYAVPLDSQSSANLAAPRAVTATGEASRESATSNVVLRARRIIRYPLVQAYTEEPVTTTVPIAAAQSAQNVNGQRTRNGM